jgi:hypothetical protein
MKPQTPIAYLHQMIKPDKQPLKLLSYDADNPWGHWSEEYRAHCLYKLMPLYDNDVEDFRTEKVAAALDGILGEKDALIRDAFDRGLTAAADLQRAQQEAIHDRDALIRELVAALKPFTCCGDRKYLLDEEFASADAALAKAKAQGYEP